VTLFEELLAEPAPAVLLAVTVKVYETPALNPEMVIGLEAPEAVMLPGLDVTVYEVIADPPLLDGVVNATDAFNIPAVAVPITGADGTTAVIVMVPLAVVKE
jgi:hypothetical protein